MVDQPAPELSFVPDPKQSAEDKAKKTVPLLVTALCELCCQEAGMVVIKYDPTSALDPDVHNRVFIRDWTCRSCKGKLVAGKHVFFIPIEDDWDGGPNWKRYGEFGACLPFKKVREMGFTEEQIQLLTKNRVCLTPISTWVYYKLPLPEGLVVVPELEAIETEVREEAAPEAAAPEAAAPEAAAPESNPDTKE